jgi:hypothetical protein
MRIAYYTTDEVNRFLVRRWAGREGIRVVTPVVQSRADAYDGPVVLDFDNLPEATRADWLRRLTAGTRTGPALVHGHNIADAEATALRTHGDWVCRGRVRRAALCRWLVAATVPVTG